MMEGRVGQVVVMYYSKNMTWNISNFRELPEEVDYFVESPAFSCGDASWRLRVYPNGTSNHGTEGRVGVALVRNQSREPEHRVQYTVGIAKGNGETYEDFSSQHIYDQGNLESGSFRFGTRETAQSQAVSAGGLLATFCRMRVGGHNGNVPPRPRVQVAVPSNIGLAKLQQDFLKLLHSGMSSDVVLNVQGSEFKAHRSILRARSPVFSSLLADDPPRNSTAILTVDDCDPDTFPDFLHYLYTGRTEALNTANAISLYNAADAYDLTELKDKCLACMMHTLTVDTFCDVMELGLRQEDRDLTDVATMFFVRNAERIIVTARWLAFLTKNIGPANNLFIAAFTHR